MRDGDRVRITTQLIDARRDAHIWAESYDRELSAILTLQSDIAHDVARQISLELTPEDEARLGTNPTVDPAAHEEYLKGRILYLKGTHEDTVRSMEHFQEAIRIDPDYALGYAGLADAYS